MPPSPLIALVNGRVLGDHGPREGLAVLVRGKRWHIAGTVCMDQFVVDFGDEPVAEGDEVVLIGPGDGGEPTPQDWADALGTISYEIVTRFGASMPRSYLPVAFDNDAAAHPVVRTH